MNYLITGGSGFIGTNLVNRLRRDISNNIKILDIVQPKENGDLWIEGDICEKGMISAYENIDIVIHLAYEPGVEQSVKDPVGTIMSNTLGTLRSLDASKQMGVKRFIFASSGGTVLGKQEVPLHEELIPNPASPYGAGKLACEGYCKTYYSIYNLETVILRFSNVYGPHSQHKKLNLIPGFIMNIINNKLCYINGDGLVTKDYIFIEDLLDVIMNLVFLKRAAGEIYQIGSGYNSSVNDVARLLGNLTYKLLGKDFRYSIRDERIGDISYKCDITKIKRDILFAPKYNLETGIEVTFKWFIDCWR